MAPTKSETVPLGLTLVVLIDSNRGGSKEVYQLLHSLGLEWRYEFWTFEIVEGK